MLIIRTLKNITISVFALTTVINSISAAEWSYKIKGGKNIKASITPLKYGKKWAYSVEFDDSGSFVAKYVADLFDQYKYTDAPPGIKGGNERKLVGTCALMYYNLNSPNSHNLNYEQIGELVNKGWGVVNHSYWHSGKHWSPKERNTPEQYHRELYWSQTLFGHLLYKGEYTTSYFAYANGDKGYGDHFEKYGLVFGSTAGYRPLTISDSMDYKKVGRNNMDWPGWKKRGADPMEKVPTPRPQDGRLFADFTHKIKGVESENYQVWQKRLNTIFEKYGKSGDDSVWADNSENILSYVKASKVATVTIENGTLIVSLPDDIQGSQITVSLEGVSEGIKLKAPKGGTLYRKGDKAWITTPYIGRNGVTMPEPLVKKVFEGDSKGAITFAKPIKFAGIRLLQLGKYENYNDFKITFTLVDGSTVEKDFSEIKKRANMKSCWGLWQLFPLVPLEEPIEIKFLSYPNEKCFKKAEVWAVK